MAKPQLSFVMAQFKLSFVMAMFELTFGVYINAYSQATVDILMAMFKFTFDCKQLPCLCLTDFGGCDTVLLQKMCVVCY